MAAGPAGRVMRAGLGLACPSGRANLDAKPIGLSKTRNEGGAKSKAPRLACPGDSDLGDSARPQANWPVQIEVQIEVLGRSRWPWCLRSDGGGACRSGDAGGPWFGLSKTRWGHWVGLSKRDGQRPMKKLACPRERTHRSRSGIFRRRSSHPFAPPGAPDTLLGFPPRPKAAGVSPRSPVSKQRLPWPPSPPPAPFT
jgi:hypothetical protein